MDIKLKMYQPFMTCVNKLKEKYGEEFERLNGFHNDNLNFNSFIDGFIDSDNVANATIDGNANASNKDVCSLTAEIDKPHTKLLAYNKIFYEMTKKYGLATAQEWLEQEWRGAFYMHDAPSSSMKSYCFAYDLDDVVNKGLFFVNGFHNDAPKHLSTYNHDVLEFVSWTSNRTSGACGLPSYLIYSYYFWKHDVETGYYINSPKYHEQQGFQEIIWGLNQPYLRINQSAFTNFTIMDRPYLEEIFGGRQYPDGTYVIDYIDDIIQYEKDFMDEVSKTRETAMFTFPVITYSLLYRDGKFVDEEFARWCNRHNMKWADANFFVSKDITSLSSCCFSADTKVLIKSSSGIYYEAIKNIVDGEYSKYRRNFTVFHNGSWVSAKTVKLPSRNMYEIITANNKKIVATDNHIFPTLNGDKTVKDLTTNDYLMFNTRKLDSFPEKNNNLTYEEGYIVGLYAGDGSAYCPKNEEWSNRITFSLNKSNLSDIDIIQRGLDQLNIKNKITKNFDNELLTVNITSQILYDFIKQYLHGDYAYNKMFDMNCLYENSCFRKGIIDGWYASDGGNSNRIYSVSEKLIETGEVIFTSLGINTIIDSDERCGEVRFCENGKEYTNNYPLKCIRWYDMKNKRSMKDIYKIDNNTEYFKINSIKPIEYNEPYVYCFNVINNTEPYFTLPNGIITHNCRLVNNFNDLHKDDKDLHGFINSIGGTALKIGSVKVNDINLAHIAYESKTANKQESEKKYLEILIHRVKLCMETLDTVRHIISRNIEKGLLPNYTYKLIELKDQFCTIGIGAMYEAIQYFGYIGIDEFGNKYYTDDGIRFASEILDTINSTKEQFKKEQGYDYSFNVEASPSERSAAILYRKDELLFNNVPKQTMYSNQWIALTEKCTIQEKVRLGAILDKKCGGGQISHINLEAPFANEEQAWKLLNYIAKSGVIYFAYNLKISTCKNGHGFIGKTCPYCGEPVEDTWQRVVGFLTPSKAYSKERKEEYSHRYWYNLNDQN